MFNDIMGFTETDYVYNQSRAHSADMFFMKMRMWFWVTCASLSFFFLGNIMGVFDINVGGWLVDNLWHSWEV